MRHLVTVVAIGAVVGLGAAGVARAQGGAAKEGKEVGKATSGARRSRRRERRRQ